jgi:hypothetical protein
MEDDNDGGNDNTGHRQGRHREQWEWHDRRKAEDGGTTTAASRATREREGEGERGGDHGDGGPNRNDNDDEQARGAEEGGRDGATPPPPASRATARGVDGGWNDDMEGMGTTTQGRETGNRGRQWDNGDKDDNDDGWGHDETMG